MSEKKRKIGMWIVTAVLAVMVSACTACVFPVRGDRAGKRARLMERFPVFPLSAKESPGNS